MKLTPTHDNVLVELEPPDSPSSPVYARVLAVGPGRWAELQPDRITGSKPPVRLPMCCKGGDRVMVRSGAVSTFTETERRCVVGESDIVAVVEG